MPRIFLLLVIVLPSMVHAQAGVMNLDSLSAIWYDESKSALQRLDAIDLYLNADNSTSFYDDRDSIQFLVEAELALAKEIDHTFHIVKALLNLSAIQNWNGNMPGALDFIDQAQDLANTKGDEPALARCYQTYATYYYSTGDLAKSYGYLAEAIELTSQLEDKHYKAELFSYLANLHGTVGNYERAIRDFRTSAQLYNEVGDRRNTIKILMFIARRYYNLEKYDSSKAFLQRALNLSDGIKNNEDFIHLNYTIWSRIYEKEGDYERAINYARSTLEYAIDHSKLNDFVNLARIYEKANEKDSSLLYLSKAMDLNSGNTGIRYVYNIISFGNILADNGEFTRAFGLCTEALDTANRRESTIHQGMACRCLYKIYLELSDFEKALRYRNLSLGFEDSLNVEAKSKELMILDFDHRVYEDSIAKAKAARLILEAHEEELAQEELTRNYIAGAGLLFFIIAGGFYNRWRYVRKSKAVLQVEKDRSENLLLNILPEEIAQELKEKGKADARDFDMVSILFTDFKGFTQASAKLSAQDLVSEINTCFEAFDGIMGKYNIEKIKTIGDAYMAAGGLPVPTEDSVKNTVLAALEMQIFIGKRKAEMDVAGKPAFDMRVGIHTGPVVAGIVGVKKFQYDIWGDTVNTASRMESHGAVGKVNISNDTYELIKEDNQFSFESRGKVQVKGKGEMEMWFVNLKREA